jgi:hypothetical protein
VLHALCGGDLRLQLAVVAGLGREELLLLLQRLDLLGQPHLLGDEELARLQSQRSPYGLGVPKVS